MAENSLDIAFSLDTSEAASQLASLAKEMSGVYGDIKNLDEITKSTEQTMQAASGTSQEYADGVQKISISAQEASSAISDQQNAIADTVKQWGELSDTAERVRDAYQYIDEAAGKIAQTMGDASQSYKQYIEASTAQASADKEGAKAQIEQLNNLKKVLRAQNELQKELAKTTQEILRKQAAEKKAAVQSTELATRAVRDLEKTRRAHELADLAAAKAATAQNRLKQQEAKEEERKRRELEKTQAAQEKIRQSQTNLTQELARQVPALNALSRGWEGLKNAMQGVQQVSKGTAQAVSGAQSAAGGLQAGAANASGSLAEMASSIGIANVGYAALAAAIASAAKATWEFIDSSVELSGRLETLQLHLKYMSDSGDDAQGIMESLREASKYSGFGVEELGSAAQAAVRAGADPQESMRRITDLANATGQSLEKTAGAYARALSGNSRALMALSRSYGISTNELALFGAHLDKNGKIAAKTSDDVDALKQALDSLIDAKYSGATADALNTLEGSQRALEASINRTKSAIGDKFLPMWKEFYDTIYASMRMWEGFTESLSRDVEMPKWVSEMTSFLGKIGVGGFAFVSGDLGKAAADIDNYTNEQTVNFETKLTSLSLRIKRIAEQNQVDLLNLSESGLKKLQEAGVGYGDLEFARKQIEETVKEAKEAGDKEAVIANQVMLRKINAAREYWEEYKSGETARLKALEDASKKEEELRKQQEEAEKQRAKEREQAAVDEANAIIKATEERQKERVDEGEATALEAVRETLAVYQKVLDTNEKIKGSVKARKVLENQISKSKKEEGQEERKAIVERASDFIKQTEEERQEAVENRSKTELQAANDAIEAYKRLLDTDREIADSVKARQKIEAQISSDIRSRRKAERLEATEAAEERIKTIEQERTSAVKERGRSEIAALNEAIKKYQAILKSDSQILSHAEARKRIEKQLSALVDERKKKEESILAMQREAGASLITAQRNYETERNRTIDKEMKLLALKSGGTETATYKEKEKAVTAERQTMLSQRHQQEQKQIKAQESQYRKDENLREGTAAYAEALMRERTRLRESDTEFFNAEIAIYKELQAKERPNSQKWKELQKEIEGRIDKIRQTELAQAKDEFEQRIRAQGLSKDSAAYKTELETYRQQRKAIEQRYQQQDLDTQIVEEQRRQDEARFSRTSSAVDSAVKATSDSVSNLGASASECTIALDGFKKLDLGPLVAAFELLRNKASDAAQALGDIPNTIQVIVKANINSYNRGGGTGSQEAQYQTGSNVKLVAGNSRKNGG